MLTRVPFTTARAVHLVAAFRNRLDAAADTASLMQATDAAHAFDAAMLAADREAFWNSTEEPCAA